MSPKAVLLLEDEIELGKTLKLSIERMLTIEVHWCRTLGEVREWMKSPKTGYQWVGVFDRMLPDGDSLSLCREIRAHETLHEVPLLILSARGEVEDRVAGLRHGADDYLPKPFHLTELQARIESLFRRASTLLVEVSKNLWHREPSHLTIHGPLGTVKLTSLEYKMACYLMDRPGELVSREELLKEVWGFSLLPKTRTVDQFLGRLRKFFEKDPERPLHFRTVRGMGYRFDPESQQSPEGLDAIG
jgi:DNA-binding response OmpR family regulator